jgi:hypothetical protein
LGVFGVSDPVRLGCDVSDPRVRMGVFFVSDPRASEWEFFWSDSCARQNGFDVKKYDEFCYSITLTAGLEC